MSDGVNGFRHLWAIMKNRLRINSHYAGNQLVTRVLRNILFTEANTQDRVPQLAADTVGIRHDLFFGDGICDRENIIAPAQRKMPADSAPRASTARASRP